MTDQSRVDRQLGTVKEANHLRPLRGDGHPTGLLQNVEVLDPDVDEPLNR